ncbi:MAG: hypothetical protein RLN75_05025 [Longimicrobiales bacterium]
MAGGRDGDDARLAREVTHRAIRRLGLLETVLMLAAGIFALLAGALAALLVAEVTGWAFRPVWIAASVIFFVVPGGTVLIRARRDEAERRARLERANPNDD